MTYVIIGYGNVGYHIDQMLQKLGHTPIAIFSKKTSVDKHIQKWSGVVPNCDVLFITTNDSNIQPVAESILHFQGIVVHCAGSLPLDVIPERFSRAVLYPLQTFSKKRPVLFSEIPFFIEADNEQVLQKLIALFPNQWCHNLHRVSYKQRKFLHLAAVWACNFTNHLFVIAQRILNDCDLSFDFLKPLIHETIHKLDDLTPFEAQTGPALRNDQRVIEMHLHMLSENFPSLVEMYQSMTNAIIQTHHHE